jgi:hypothetical protein
MALALVLAAVLRLSRLDDAALQPGESALAWPAARAVLQGQVAADGIASPFGASAQALAFAMTGPSEWMARLPSVLCGLALVLVPLLLRETLGGLRTATLAVLAATSPSLVVASRDAAGPAPALLAAALAAAGLVRWRDDGRADARRARAWALVASAACGALTTTGPEAWGLVPLVALVARACRPWRIASPGWGACAAAMGLGVLLPASAGLWALPWTAGVSASLTAWLEGLSSPAPAAIGLGFLRSHPFTVVLAVAGLAWARPKRFLLVALAWSILLATRGTGSTVALAATLSLVAAHGLAGLLAARPRPRRAGLAAAAAASLVQVATAARPALPHGAAATPPGLELLVKDLEAAAVERGREASELPVVVLEDPPDPGLAWALRRFRMVRYAAVRPAVVDGVSPALVSWPTDPPAPPPARYVGATYASPRGPVQLWVPLGS